MAAPRCTTSRTASPASSQQSCIRVNYTGSLAADVHIYRSAVDAELAPHVNLLIEAGTQAVACLPDLHRLDGRLWSAARSTTARCSGSEPTTPPAPLITPFGAGSWTNGSAVVYRVTATVSHSAPDTVQGKDTGAHTLTWEAQNQ